MVPPTRVYGGVFNLSTDHSPPLPLQSLPAGTLNCKGLFLKSQVGNTTAKARAQAWCYPIRAVPPSLPQAWIHSLWVESLSQPLTAVVWSPSPRLGYTLL